MSEIEPDIDATDERLWELYQEWCKHNGVKPTFKGYHQWLEERY